MTASFFTLLTERAATVVSRAALSAPRMLRVAFSAETPPSNGLAARAATSLRKDLRSVSMAEISVKMAERSPDMVPSTMPALADSSTRLVVSEPLMATAMSPAPSCARRTSPAASTKNVVLALDSLTMLTLSPFRTTIEEAVAVRAATSPPIVTVLPSSCLLMTIVPAVIRPSSIVPAWNTAVAALTSRRSISPALIQAVVEVVTEESLMAAASTVASRSWTSGWYLPERTTMSVFAIVPLAATIRCW